MNTSPTLIIVLALTFSPSLSHAQFGTSDLKSAASLLQSEDKGIEIPNLQETSVGDLSKIALQALSGLGSFTAQAYPQTGSLIDTVKQAIQTNNTQGALQSLSGITDALKDIPGANNLLATSQQLVSAWALKQGFSPTQISGVMAALQTRDVADLGVQATQLLSDGRLNQEQTTLLKGVLNAFGINNANAGKAVDKVKGLFGR